MSILFSFKHQWVLPVYLASAQAEAALSLYSPTGRLEEYLGSMAKIQKAVEYFQDNSPDSPELNKVVRGQWTNAGGKFGQHRSLPRSHEGHWTFLKENIVGETVVRNTICVLQALRLLSQKL